MKRYSLILTLAIGLIGALLLLWNQDFFNNIEKRPFVDELLGEAEVSVKSPDEVEIVLVGDVMLSRHVNTKMTTANSQTLPFDDLAYELARADITFGNLESPFYNAGPAVAEGLVFKAEPQAVAGLVKAGFDVMSAANNHAFDQGLAGLTFTNKLLRENNILSVGTGTTTLNAWQPAVFEVADTKIAFLAASYASYNDGGKNKNDYVARMEDTKYLTEAIKQLRQKVDIIIVSMHAGNEYTRTPNQQQETFAHAAIDAGADIVVGAHPHWVQGYELYPTSPSRGGVGGEVNQKKGIIFYSLGNFIFDQEWSQETKEGLMVRIKIKDKKLNEAKLVPVILENYCCARLADEKEAVKILSDITATSAVDLKGE